MTTKTIDEKDYMEDGQCRLVHQDNIDEIDKTRNSLVLDLIGKAQNLQEKLKKFKEDTAAEISAFIDLSAMEYDTKIGGAKGNLTLFSYDTKYKIQVQISEHLTFDERLQVAKSMIDECLNAWTKESRSEIKTIINDAFSVDQEGKINTKRILGLRRLKIDDKLWQKAMKAITDSLQITGSKSYIRMYKRDSQAGPWKNITLDFASF
ncbi:MAG: DUF3164 family protein [Desulfobacteraceae bacterium]|nr:DUF3164 family protein [Desulfobacteraceae bacterium]